MWKNYVLLLKWLAFLKLVYGELNIEIRTDPDPDPVNMEPFINISGGFYYFETRLQKNWFEAYEECRLMDAELITFDTVAEWNAIVKHLKDRNDRSDYWTSGNDLAREGTYNWFSNAKRVNINRWAHNQPDNANGHEHCTHLGYIYIDSRTIELNDRPCRNQDNRSLFHYICERAVPFLILHQV